MKKIRFGLLTKIILLTGLLTILTVSASLVISTLVLQQNSRNIYIKNCEDVTDYVESVFFTETEDKVPSSVVNMMIDRYETVRDNYDNLDEAALKDYQQSMIVDLFDPEPGTMGMDYSKGLRKTYYTNSVAGFLSLSKTFSVQSSTIFLFDSEKERLISFADNTITFEENYKKIGLLLEKPTEKELDFYQNSSQTNSYKVMVNGETVVAYNYVNINITDQNYKCFVKGYFSLKETNASFRSQLVTELFVTVASAVVLVLLYAIFTKLFLIKNVDRLKDATNRFVGMMKDDEKLEIVDSNVKTTDEIRELSDSFEVMQGQIITYVDNIKKAKDIEQAFKMEVEIASKIQLESLPANTYFDRNIELRAFIKPARGVGGDFYDYFYVDEDHLAMVVADVSGKGIPASLFMMRAKESIRSASMNEKDLSKVLFKVNNSLCVNNKEGFFVTAFLGVLDLKTYEFKFASAGHERPFIKHVGECKRLEVESNFVLGLEEDFPYKEESIKLEEGDAIILYTDGLNEAINANKEEFGYERIKDSLLKDNELKQNIETAVKDLEAFEGEEEQFDDITMLGFKIKKDTASYSYLNPTYNDILDLTDKVENYLEGLEPAILSKIGVIIDEVMNNIISYGKTKTNKTLNVSVEKTDGGANLIFVDNSHPFNPLLKEKRTIEQNMEEGIIGGVGISIVKSISKEAEYSYSNNKNILIIKF